MAIRGAARAVSAGAHPTMAAKSKQENGRKAARRAQRVKEQLSNFHSTAHIDRNTPTEGPDRGW